MAKSKKLCVLSLLALLGLTACSNEIIAKPSNYDSKILETSEEIYNNKMSIIYDAIRKGTLAEDVLNELLYQYAISAFGRYNNYIPKLAGGNDDDNITLKAAAADIKIHGPNENATVARRFIESHKAYQTTDDDGNRDTSAEGKTSELVRVIEKWYTIEDRIAEKMYDAISSGFSYRNKFDESKYYYSLRKDLKNVIKPDNTTFFQPQILDPKVNKEEVFSNFLHRTNYQTNFSLEAIETSEKQSYPATYVEDELVPAIYRTLLTEQYLFEETYNTLGRSYAREVNVISITKNSKYPTAAEYLMKEFVGSKVISKAPDAAEIKDSSKINDSHFEMISEIYNGVELDQATGVKATIRDQLVADKAIVPAIFSEGGYIETYYKGTEYGNMMERYTKIVDDPLLTDASEETTFTGSGSYVKEVGKEIETDSIRLKDHITNGWFVKGGDLSATDTITSRLFSVGVASALNTGDEYDRFYKDGEGNWKYDSSRDYNKYVARINGSYFLKVEATEAHDATDPEASAEDILFRDGDNYYVVQILEAANVTKLSKTDEGNYAHLYNANRMEEIVNDIAKVISKNETYETLAKKYWLKKMDIVYNDDVVYDYFKTNFPELFD